MTEPAAIFDTSTKAGAQAVQRLKQEPVIWLTTVRADGQPQSSPVWFDWNGSDLLVFSQPGAGKVRNITGRPLVAAHLADDEGSDVVTIEARAELGTELTDAEAESYLDKYATRIEAIGLTPESMRASYSAVLRLRPSRVRIY
ncbi:MAG TPA: pyridoxamine 5'-phosphate oxidase family protein [Mycobacteriales bacterium]|nr:pyridoxamine 5'-phosphate oxidase family protein [Mycobacteriales bacterium]